MTLKFDAQVRNLGSTDIAARNDGTNNFIFKVLCFIRKFSRDGIKSCEKISILSSFKIRVREGVGPDRQV